jgi:23S rRNA pseudouridine1911/1915/1917 synthase
VADFLDEEMLDEEEDGSSPPREPEFVELTAQPRNGPVRLDQFLVHAFPGLYSRSQIQHGIESGATTVNGKVAKASYKVRGGDCVRLAKPVPLHGLPAPENIPLDIIYEDDCLAVVNKPPHMVVHPAKGNWSGTLVNALRFHFQQLSGINGDYRPGIVHRLDRDTSGVILVAKEETAHRLLSEQFEARKVYKEYHALTQGVLDRDSDYVEKAIGHHPHDRTKMMVFAQANEARNIKPACTFYEVVERFNGFTYCKAFPKTGRTHQIRVHLAAVGCPILADEHYSGRKQFKLSDLTETAQDEILLPRQALHARRLRFLHPRENRWIEVEAPLPSEFTRTLEALRQYRPRR